MSMILFATAAVAVVLIGLTSYFSPWVWRRHRMRAIRREITEKRILALTYDDGPSETLTPRLLDLLQQHNATATFFMLGRNVKRFPHLVERVHAWKAAPWRAVADIDAGFEKLAPWTPKNGMFRPPFGKMTLPTFLSIARRGSPIWWWTIDSGDSYKVLPQPAQVVEALQCQKGGIVLMHDLHDADLAKERDDFVLETTAALLQLAEQESLQVMPLENL
jgi:peptidoglycan/xylan/chitin deacetylase (PgdA/CDA1 family)